MSITEDEIEAAVSAGALPAEAAAALRTFVEQKRGALQADEESFRLLTGFNDIFVAIALVISLGALAWLTSQFSLLGSAVAVATASWALAEFFTRVRRMALPSLLLLFAFVGAVVTGVFVLSPESPTQTQSIAYIVIAGVCGGVAAFLHWRRFKVPVTVAAGVASLGMTGVGLVAYILDSEDATMIAALVAGLVAFAVALAWDMSDPLRKTRRADVAFWLHLLAAPVIVHPLFRLLGVGRTGAFFPVSDDGGAPISASGGLSVTLISLAIYVALSVVALVVDRRALMVSGLLYLLYATYAALRLAGSDETSYGAAALIVGSGLLLLSAFWATARRFVLRFTPAPLRARLPPVG